jgi:hypothetical protein
MLESYVKDAVETLCRGVVQPLLKPVIQSEILSAPDYSFSIDINPASGVSRTSP